MTSPPDMKLTHSRFPIICHLAISIVGLAALSPPTLAQIQPAAPSHAYPHTHFQATVSQLPAPPRTPPPNRTRSGGSLGEDPACQDGHKSLVALVPETNPVLTVSAHPTFWVYIPYAPAEIASGEFSVLVGLHETTQLYRTQFTLPETPGIVSISLPTLPEYALEEGIFYHWYFKLYCQGNTTSTANLEVNAWVQRIVPNADTDRQINAATPDIWYDSLTQLADRLQTSPEDGELRDRWQHLLEFIHAEDLSRAPWLGAVHAIELN